MCKPLSLGPSPSPTSLEPPEIRKSHSFENLSQNKGDSECLDLTRSVTTAAKAGPQAAGCTVDLARLVRVLVPLNSSALFRSGSLPTRRWTQLAPALHTAAESHLSERQHVGTS